jgi:hypothetical protein
MRSRVRFPVLSWGFFLEGEDPLGNHGLGSLVEFRFNPLNAKLNPICHLLTLLGADPVLHVSRIKVKAPPGTSYSYITIHLIGTT